MTESENTLKEIIERKPSFYSMKQWFRYLEKYKPTKMSKEDWLEMMQAAKLRNALENPEPPKTWFESLWPC